MSQPQIRFVDVTPFLQHAEMPQVYQVRAISFDVLTISGQSGTLKSSVAKELAHTLGVTLSRRGGDLRETLRKKTGTEIVGSVQTERSTDERLDVQTRLEIAQAQNTNTPIIIEGRLAGILLCDERKKRGSGNSPQLRSLAILITSANDAKREHRIYKRQQKRDITIAPQNIAVQTANRHADDTKRWQQQYGDLLGGQNPFEPGLRNNAGDLIYDLPLLIDHQPDSLTIPSDATREAMICEILHELHIRGLIKLGTDS